MVEITNARFEELLHAEAMLKVVETLVKELPSYHWSDIFKAMFGKDGDD